MAEAEDRLRDGLLCENLSDKVTGMIPWHRVCVNCDAFSALIPCGQEVNPRCNEETVINKYLLLR
jgi:hypothetical protein